MKRLFMYLLGLCAIACVDNESYVLDSPARPDHSVLWGPASNGYTDKEPTEGDWKGTPGVQIQFPSNNSLVENPLVVRMASTFVATLEIEEDGQQIVPPWTAEPYNEKLVQLAPHPKPRQLILIGRNTQGEELARHTVWVSLGQKQTQLIPIIAVSANVLKEDREKCMQVGMNMFIAKPYQLSKLKAALAQHSPSLKCPRVL